jgi:hypothetical protein
MFAICHTQQRDIYSEKKNNDADVLMIVMFVMSMALMALMDGADGADGWR